MTQPATGDTVTIDYVLRRGDGKEVGNTAHSGPQDIQLGSGQIFPQIEAALAAMAIGEQQSIAIACAEAFGPRQDALLVDIPRAELPPGREPEEGMALQAQRSDGEPLTLYIVEVGEAAVTADGNHPLAGEDLTFDITLRGIKPGS